MEQKPGSIDQWLLRKKILRFPPFAVPEMIERLKDNQDAIFVEMAVDIFHKSEIDSSSQLLGILNSIKDPYTHSLVCMLLGLIGTEEAVKPVGGCYLVGLITSFTSPIYNRTSNSFTPSPIRYS